MFWNYRIVNLKSENGGEDWYCVREVYYDEKRKPEGHSDVSVGSESLEDVQNVLDMMSKALKLPALQESDFHDESRKNKFSDFSEFMEYCINNDVRGL
jgi:hypothetical protein